MTSDEWQRRRSEFNHDWFKPRYLIALQSFLERLEAADAGSGKRLWEFVELDFPAWSEKSIEAWWLLENFEAAMSPASFFESKPLSACGPETRKWLAPLVHALWLERCAVRARLARAEAFLVRVDEGYAKLADNLSQVGADLQRLQSGLPVWKEFADSCHAFSQCLSEFPHRVEVL